MHIEEYKFFYLKYCLLFWLLRSLVLPTEIQLTVTEEQSQTDIEMEWYTRKRNGVGRIKSDSTIFKMKLASFTQANK